ncbi:hypothetical protein ACKVMT_16800 [Halobacteriales archaeon Cl-PHB]
MLSSPDARRTFLRDALVVTVVAGLALGGYRTYLGPSALWLPGQALYFPFLVVYSVLGGELEGPAGPSTVLLVAYVVGLGLVGATLTRLARGHVEAGRRQWGIAAAAVAATVAVIAVLVAVPSVSPVAVLGLLVAAAVVLVGVLAMLVVTQ